MKEYLNNNIKRIKIAQNYNEITNILSYMEQYLLYFKEHWIGNIELGWTYYDKLIAANILNMTVDSIPNNYFEAFNNQLKTHQLDRFKNRRNLLRLDILTLWIKSSGSNQIEQQIYIVTLLPNIYCQCLDFLSRSGVHTATIWINWLRLQLSQNTYYSNLQYNQLPLITLPSQEEALKLLNKDKDQIKELLLFEQKLQDVHRDDNNTLEDNITSNNRDKTATSIETTLLSTETTPLTPLDLNTKHSISIWKQEYITSISNLLADLNFE
ncbi:unnamed protein product [Rhizophagus irregularis]|nr:unnamed protein product [Rhizophagus irregularis]